MEFIPTDIEGCYIIQPRKFADERGYFARAWCETELREAGLADRISQSNMAHNPHKGTLRGLHLQLSPHEETKILRCVRGRIFDVAVDLRPNSSTYCKWFGTELNPENAHALYVPMGCATGYLTLQDDVEIYYHASTPFVPEFATGVRYNDPVFGIEWPGDVRFISDVDKNWPDYKPVKRD